MAILAHHLKVYGSAVMPDDDVTQQIGGAIDQSIAIVFTEAAGLFQAVSSAAGDTTQAVTVFYRDSAGAIQSESKTLNGTTPVGYVASFEALYKALKGATAAGDVAVEAQTATRQNTAQSGDAVSITLDTGASAVDDFYNGQVCRLDDGQIRQVIDYVGSSRKAFVDRPWTSNPTGSTAFRIAVGIVFAKAPVEVMQVRRLFYDVAADDLSGADKSFFDKFFIKNTHGSLALTSAQVIEVDDPSALITFALETTLDGSGTNGVGNVRTVAPVSGVTAFDNTAKDVANAGSLTAGAAQGVWAKLFLAKGSLAASTTWTARASGFSAP